MGFIKITNLKTGESYDTRGNFQDSYPGGTWNSSGAFIADGTTVERRFIGETEFDQAAYDRVKNSIEKGNENGK